MKPVNPLSCSLARILLVDDAEPWRRFVRSMLIDDERLHLVGEAGDGFEAVQKAQTLQPDAILLDIGLPGLNGIEAARQIGQVAPSAKILFVSQITDGDVIRAALSNGAKGYVLKMNAGHDLLPGLRAVLRGGEFVSSDLEN